MGDWGDIGETRVVSDIEKGLSVNLSPSRVSKVLAGDMEYVFSQDPPFGFATQLSGNSASIHDAGSSARSSGGICISYSVLLVMLVLVLMLVLVHDTSVERRCGGRCVLSSVLESTAVLVSDNSWTFHPESVFVSDAVLSAVPACATLVGAAKLSAHFTLLVLLIFPL